MVSTTGNRWPSIAALPQAVAPVVAILLFPALTFLVVPVKLYQREWTDAYFYTAYIYDYAATLGRYGMTYYGNRIAYIFAEKPFVLLLGSHAGFHVFRFVLLAAASAAVYSIARRFYGTAVALLATAWLCFTPWLIRAIFSTHVDGMATVYLLVGIALLIVPVRRRVPCHALAGAAFALATNCNIVLLPVALTLGPGWLYLNREQGWRWTSRTVLVLLAGYCAGYLALGVLMTVATAGEVPFFFDVMAIRIATGVFDGAGAPWFKPFGEFLFEPRNSYLVIPQAFFLAVAALAVRELWSSPRRPGADLAVFAAIHLGGVVLFALLMHFFRSGWLSLFFYNMYFFPGCMLALICVLGALDRSVRTATARRWLFAVLGAAFALPLLPLLLEPLMKAIAATSATGWYAAGIVIVAASLLVRRSAIAGAVAVALMAVLPLSFYTYERYTLAPDAREGRLEWDVYDAAVSLQRFMRQHVPIQVSLGFWYPNKGPSWLNGVQSMFLWGYSRVSAMDGSDPGMPVINADVRTRIARWDMLALLAGSAAELDEGIASLTRAGIPFREVARTTFNGKEMSLHVAVVSLKPGGAPRP